MVQDFLEKEQRRLLRLVAAHPGLFRGELPDCASWIPPGWYELVDRLCAELEANLGDDFAKLMVEQIREKFAGLRFYYALDLPEPPGAPMPPIVTEHTGGFRISGQVRNPLAGVVRRLVDEAEQASFTICQWCGAAGAKVVVDELQVPVEDVAIFWAGGSSVNFTLDRNARIVPPPEFLYRTVFADHTSRGR